MKTKAFLITAFVLGSSSVALADVSFSASARARVTWNAGYSSPPSAPVVRDHRTPNRFRPYYQAYQAEYFRPRTLPALTGPTWNCHNWDPSIEIDSVCAAYASATPRAMPEMLGSWTNLGVRDSAIPDNQFITVERSFRELALQANSGAPTLVKLGVRFMDGSVQVIDVSGRLRGNSEIIRIGGFGQTISQVVIYTASNSRGTYSVLAR